MDGFDYPQMAHGEEIQMTKESTEYQNLIGEKVDATPATLEDLIGEQLVEVSTFDWKDHWHDMPEYVSEKKIHKTVTVQFRNQEDYEDFQKLIGQNLTSKTKGIWYPALDVDTDNFLMRWIEDDQS